MNLIRKILSRLIFWSTLFLGILIIYWVLPLILNFSSNVPVIIFFDVGQGDSALIKTATGRLILIDGGPDNKILQRLGKYLPYFCRRLDLVVVSHYHDDHIIGLIETLRRYQVSVLIVPTNNGITSASEELFKQAQQQKIKTITLNDRLRLDLETDCSLTLTNPDSLGAKINSNNSIMAQFDCRNRRFLLNGDNEQIVERVLLASSLDLQADVFKASHHGSITANSLDFLRAINPVKMIISVGRDNKFKHPHPEVISRAEETGIVVWRTDILGNILIRY